MTPQPGPHVLPIKKPIRNQAKIEYYDGEAIEGQNPCRESRNSIKFKMATLKNRGFLSEKKNTGRTSPRTGPKGSDGTQGTKKGESMPHNP